MISAFFDITGFNNRCVIKPRRSLYRELKSFLQYRAKFISVQQQPISPGIPQQPRGHFDRHADGHL
jgi:hypothetical protein